MKIVNATADIMNQLLEIKSDSKEEEVEGILGMSIGSTQAYVQLNTGLFLNSFTPRYYDVECDADFLDYPFNLKSELDGVLFLTFLSAEEVVELKDTHTKHFDYITKSVQEL